MAANKCGELVEKETMIKSVSLKGYKCFESAKFDLGRINVFTGYNGRGKSSLIQALLMLSQSVLKGDLRTLEVNGCYIHQESFDDILSKITQKNQFTIQVEGEDSSGKNHNLRLTYKKKSRTKGEICGFVYNGNNLFETAADLSQLDAKKVKGEKSLFNYPPECHNLFRDYSYLSANRLGVTLYEDKKDPDSVNPLGAEGQNRLSILQGNKDLQEAIGRQISYIMDGGEIVVLGDEDESPVLNLGFKNIGNTPKDVVLKSINCGFGYSYILSILVLAQTANSGCLFIENPEAHLHPSAQSRLMEVLCQACYNKGIQLFVETHSEHIVNALRRLVVIPQSFVSPSDFFIYFFNCDFEINRLTIDEKGQIDPWPLGFFDQQENDLAEILRLGLFKR